MVDLGRPSVAEPNAVLHRVMDMRDVETVDGDLAVLVTLRSMLRDHGIRPSPTGMDELLDERLALMRTTGMVQFSSSGGR